MRPTTVKKFRNVSIVAGAIAAVLAAVVTWNQTGLPRPAMSNEVAALGVQLSELEKFNRDTRALLLNQEWERLFSQISEIESKGIRTRSDNQLLSRLRSQLRLVEQQLKELER